MAASVLSLLLTGLCAATIIQAHPMVYPGNYYYYYNPAGGYYYGPQQMVPYQTTNELGVAATPVNTPAATVPGIDIQRIREFFQSLFPFLRPSSPEAAPAPAVPGGTTPLKTPVLASPTNAIPSAFYGSSPMGTGSTQYRDELPQPMSTYYNLRYPMMPNYPAQPQMQQ